jgi:hypothetical protein
MLAVVMKMAKRIVAVNGPRIRAWLVAAVMVLWAPLATRATNAVVPDAGGANQTAPTAQAAPAARYSSSVADIVKLVDAKVDAEVIKTYVRNSPTAYNPSAMEIIALKDRGVGSEILTAMLQHGAEVRAQSVQAAQMAQSAAASQPNPGAATAYAPAYDYGTQPVYPNSAYSYPVSSYVSPSYDYAYPGYSYGWSDYGYGWPYYWPSLSFDFGCYPYRGWGGYGYGYGGRGYYGGHANYGGRGYYGGHGYYGGAGYRGQGGRSAPYAGSSGGFRSYGGGARSTSFASPAGGYRGGGGFSGHQASFGSMGGARGGGGFGGGHSSGRGR